VENRKTVKSVRCLRTSIQRPFNSNNDILL
jgi:hypothetical protein